MPSWRAWHCRSPGRSHGSCRRAWASTLGCSVRRSLRSNRCSPIPRPGSGRRRQRRNNVSKEEGHAMVKFKRSAVGLLAAVALVVAACGGSDNKSSTSSGSSTKASASKPVTINWWHIANNDPLKSIWKQAADQYMASHPNVKIKITVLENEAFKAKLTTTMQAGKPPDVFQSWGGGTMKEQADAGLIKDITEPTKSWINT